MKKILLAALISCISISSICAMSYDEREKACNGIITRLKEALQDFQLEPIENCLLGLPEVDYSDLFWKKNREIALEYAAVAVETARTAHQAYVKRLAPLSDSPNSAEKIVYEKSFQRSVHANLNQKAIVKYDLLHNKSDC